MSRWINANAKPVNRSSNIVARKYDFKCRKVENDRSAVAVVTGIVAKILSKVYIYLDKKCNLFVQVFLIEMCRKRVFCFRPEAGNEILFFPAPAGAGAGVRGRKSNT